MDVPHIAMKIFNLGLDITPGKYKYRDDRLDKLAKKFSPQKATSYGVEFTETDIEQCDGVVFDRAKKLDLILIDLEKIEKRILRAEEANEKKLLGRAQKILETETLLSDAELSQEEVGLFKTLQLVTLKPALGKDASESPDPNVLIKEILEKSGTLLFFTAGKKEVRAWSLKQGESVLEAAGKIHSDLKRGFIKAEVVNAKDLDKFFNLTEAKSRGMVKVVGRDYVVEEGDIIEIRFNV